QYDWPEIEGKWVARGLRLTRSASSALTAASIRFNALQSGHIGIRVSPRIPTGSKIPFRQRYGFDGTRYNPSTVSRITGRGLIKGALSKGTWIIALATSVVGNVIDYGFGEKRDTGILSQEFAVSTAVDTVMAVGTGLAAAAIVA
nr:hypothetical protein [Anaerolineales bacterium]